MANTVEVTRPAPVPANAPDAWHTMRTEMDRLFDRFAGGWGMPSLRRMFDVEPAFRAESSFSMPSPAVDITEDNATYRVTAELPGPSWRAHVFGPERHGLGACVPDPWPSNGQDRVHLYAGW